MSVVEPDTPERAEKAQRAQLERQAEIDELLWLMSDKRGRRFMWRLLAKTGIYRASYVPGFDAMAAAFREGERKVGLELMASINQHCPDRFSEMQKEVTKHERRSNSTGSSPST